MKESSSPKAPWERLLRPDQVGEILNISRAGVYRLLAEGQLTGLKVRGSIRILEDSINEYIDRQLVAYILEHNPETVSDSPTKGGISCLDKPD
jgi:excisionase family DNA binding protein